MKNRIRYNIKETYRHLFFQMPKFLFDDEFKDLSNDARVLYCLLKDRHELSLNNNWYDTNGDVFIIYTRKEMQDMLSLSENTIAKAMKNLKKFNLIQEEKQGLGKPNKIYLLATTGINLRLSRKIYGSGAAKFTLQEPQNLRPNNTNINKNKLINTESKSSQSQTGQDKEQKKETKIINASENSNNLVSIKDISKQSNYNKYEKIVKENIEYDYYKKYRPLDIDLVDELILCMLDIILTENETVKINGEDKNRELVKSTYLKINSRDIEHIIERYKTISHKITHLHAYLKTMLFTCKQEQGHFYTNAVRVDGIV